VLFDKIPAVWGSQTIRVGCDLSSPSDKREVFVKTPCPPPYCGPPAGLFGSRPPKKKKAWFALFLKWGAAPP